MNTNRAKIIVVMVFVLTLGAGITAGMLAARLPRDGTTPTPTVPAVGESPLTAELDLTPDQSAQMQTIWQGVSDLSLASLSKGIAAQHLRDDSIRALIPADKIDEYNKVQRAYTETMAAMKGQRESAFTRAVAGTNGILNPTQQKKYKEILAKRLGEEDADRHDPLNEAAGGAASSQPAY